MTIPLIRPCSVNGCLAPMTLIQSADRGTWTVQHGESALEDRKRYTTHELFVADGYAQWARSLHADGAITPLGPVDVPQWDDENLALYQRDSARAP